MLGNFHLSWNWHPRSTLTSPQIIYQHAGLPAFCMRWRYNLKRQSQHIHEWEITYNMLYHDDVIKWKHFPRYWPFVRGGEFTGPPSQRPVTRSFGVFFDLRPIKRFSKQSLRWWFETPSGSLWRHCNGHQDMADTELGFGQNDETYLPYDHYSDHCSR